MHNISKKAITTVQATVLVAIIVVAAIAAIAYYFVALQPLREGEEVTIGLLAPLTGGLAYLGDVCVKGMNLAIEEINAAGGIQSLGGVNLTMIVYDSGASAEEATTALRRMITLHPEMCAIFQPWPSGYLLASAPIAEDEKVPMLCTSWTDGLTESGYEYIFRVAPKASDLQNSGVRALIALGENATGRDIQRIAFAYDDNPLNKDLMDTLKEVAIDMERDVVLDETWTSPLGDATPLLQKVDAAEPDIFFCYAIQMEDAYVIVRKFSETGLNETIPQCYYGGGLMHPSFIDVLGELADGKLGISDWNPVKGSEALEERYTDYYIEEDFLPKDAALTYGATYMLKEALEQAASSQPTAVRDALSEIDITTGNATVLWGPVSFKATGDIDLGEFACVLVQWQGTELETVFPSELATAEVIWPTP